MVAIRIILSLRVAGCLAAQDGTHARELFTRYCGADVDALWGEFAQSLRSAPYP